MAAEFCIAVGANLVPEVVKSLGKTIKQEISYVCKYHSNMDDLKSLVQQLRHKEDREKLRVANATRQGDEIHKDVEEWLTKVNEFLLNEFISKVANPDVTGEEGREKIPWFSLIARYKLSKKAVKAAKSGSDLLGKSFSDVAHRPGPQRTESMYVDRDYEELDSRESILKEIMEALKDANVNRIGVSGMGGVGKTTLVNKVAWKAIQDKLFEEVAIAEVTPKPDNRMIQEKLASDLGIEFGQHENEYERARRLRNRLKKGKRILVILDNIWDRPNLEAIGIPLAEDGEKAKTAEKEGCGGIDDDHRQSPRIYKILLTSRRPDILCNEMNIDKNFSLKPLPSKEARNLFWKIAGNDAMQNSEFRTMGEEVVRKCAGLPLAVATIANALKNRSIHVWEDALHKLRTANPRSIPEMNKRVVSVLELSFDLLQSEEAKKLFLLCSLIDYGRGTSRDYLLRYGMGWGLFENVYTLETGRNRLHTLIGNLKDSCLLLEGESNTRIKMHEFVQAVAIDIASRNLMFNIQDVPDLKKELEDNLSKNPTAISLSYRDISELPLRLGCPKLELFFLFMKSDHSLQIPDDFFKEMKEVKVIDFDGINLLSLPSSFGYLANLQTLCLDECLLRDISTIGELRNLEILSFQRSNIEYLPPEIGQLSRLRLLDLRRCSKLKVIAANVISRLSLLEELLLADSSVQWENGLDNQNGSNANLVELNHLSHLTTLSICFPDAQIIPPNLCFQRLKRFRILIGDVWNWSHRNEALSTLKLKLHSNSFLGYKPIKILLTRTEELFLDELNGIDQNVLYELDGEGFPKLKHLHVQNCSELLYIANSAGRIHYNAFLVLEGLSLDNLVNLKKIWHGPLNEVSFTKLKTVQVNKCDKLKYLFSISNIKSLSQLQEIKVTDCENLLVIFAKEDEEGCVHNENETNSKIVFPHLQTLTLECLPQFTGFSSNVRTLSATNSASPEITTDDNEDFKTLFCEKVEYRRLENLKLSSIGIEKIWPEHLLSIASYCPTVKSLNLENCNGLKFLFSSSMVKSFAQLQRLVLCNCKSMEWVLDTRGLEGEESMSFPKLFSLELKDLPKVTRFGNGNIIEFPSLNALIIENCPNLGTFFSNKTVNSMENIPADKQPLFGDKVGLPSLEVLILYQMQNVRKIWDDRLSLDSFCKIKILRVNDCNELQNIFPSNMLERLQGLENLEVMNCDSLEEVFGLQVLSGQTTPTMAATQLRELHVCSLPNLKHVWNMDAETILAFENLTRIRVHCCLSLISLFPASIANGLLNLEELEIVTCSLKELISKDDKVEEVVIPRFRFPRLTSLVLQRLPALNTFYPERHISEWPALKKMQVSECTTEGGNFKLLASEWQGQQDRLQSLFLVDKVAFPSLEELKLASIPKLLHLWGGENIQLSRVFQNLEKLELSVCEKLKTALPSYASLSNLKALEVSKCNELISLVTLSTAKSLANLARINIDDCKKIEKIITQSEGNANNDDQIVLKQLNYLGLHQLPSLTSFCCLGNHAMEFPSLEKVIVGNCPKMEMLEKEHVKEGDDKEHWQDNLDSTGQELSKEMVRFRGLKYLKISEFPQLKKVWHDELLPGNFFCNLTSLVVDQCADMSRAISANLLQFLNNLELLEVRNCESLEQVFDLEELSVDAYPGLLSQLSYFYLIDLPGLTHICRRSHQEIFGCKNIKFLQVQNCGGLRYIFTASIFSSLEQLQEMKIINCSMLEAIIGTEGEDDAADRVVSPLLNSIILESLPKLKNFYSGSNILECPSLKFIAIINCIKTEAFVFTDTKDLGFHTQPFFSDKVALPALTELVLSSSMAIEMMCHSKLLAISCIENLMFLNIDECNNLKYLFPSCVVKSLVQLQELHIYKCMSMEGVVLTEDEGIGEMKIFPRLRVLRLIDIPSLQMFCSCIGNLTVLPSLSHLVIDKCGSMKAFIYASISANAEGLKENHHADIQPLFDEKVALPNLTKLVIFNMYNLRKIWDEQLTSNSFSKLKELQVWDCSKLVNIFPAIMRGRLQALHDFNIVNCESLEDIFEVQGLGCERTETTTVGQLREIHLCHLPKLKHVWNLDAQGILCSGNLQSITVHYCLNLKCLFPASIARGLLQLKELEIKSCLMEEIVAKEEVFVETHPRFVFPQLTWLSMKELPGLKSFYPGIHISEWPVLKVVEINGCDEVKIFASESLSLRERPGERQHDIPIQQTLFLVDKIMSSTVEKMSEYQRPATSCFAHVETLIMDGCGNLQYLFTASVAESLFQLQFLGIINCNLMEDVIIIDKERIREKLFPKLYRLMLKDLPKLKKFCNFNGDAIELFLSGLAIDNCPNMETFVSNSICADMTKSKGTKEMNPESSLHTGTKPLFDEKVSLPNLEELIIRDMRDLRKIWNDDQFNLDSFNKLGKMKLEYCSTLLNIFPPIMHERLQRLEVLKVQNCDSLEEIFELQAFSGQEKNAVIATQLRELQLFHLPNLKHVWNMHNRVIPGFENLNSIAVDNCNNLKSIFPDSIASNLLQLQVLSITSCMVDEIVHKEEEVEAVPRFVFPQLSSLTLTGLPRLRCFYSRINISEWPVLKKLLVSGCTKVQTLASEFLKFRDNDHPLFLFDKVAFPSLEHLELSKLPRLVHLWKENSQPSQVFQNLATLKVSECNKLTIIVPSSMSIHNLTTLEVSNCDGLISLVTSPTARRLMRLTRMDVSDCKMIEQIITVVDLENEVKDEIVFKELKYLGLDCLPSLRRFHSGNCTLEFPSLDQVIIRECSKMESFSQGVLRTPKLRKIQLTEEEDGGCWEGDLNTTIQQMFKEMDAQISTEDRDYPSCSGD